MATKTSSPAVVATGRETLVALPVPVQVLTGVINPPPATTPVPESEAVWGLSGALSATERIAERVPLALGVKITLMEQLAPAASEVPQLFVWAKSPGLLPPNEMPVILRLDVPELLSVIV